MPESVIFWEHTFFQGVISAECTMVRPGNHKVTLLVKKQLLIFVNGRPAAGTQRFYACFHDLYRDFQIPAQTIPFVIINFKLAEECFDIKLFGEIRKFYFKPQYEKRMYEGLRTYLWTLFNKYSMETDFDPGIKIGVSMPKPVKKEVSRVADRVNYKIAKPDIEHIEKDNMNDDDLTSESSGDEMAKEEIFN